MSIDFIFYLDSNWSTYHRPLERFTELSKQINASQGKVLIVDRPVDLITTPLLHTVKFFQWVGSRYHIRQLSENLFLYTPFVFLHDILSLHAPVLISINHYLLNKQINKQLSKLNFCSPNRVAWISDPRMFNCFGVCSETVKVYECIDNQMAEVSGQQAKLKIQQLEEKVLTQVDVVFCTAVGLYEGKKQFNNNTYFVPNAADTKLLTKVQDSKMCIAKRLQNIPSPIIGYLGTINEHTDIDLINYIAKARPEWTILMIGSEKASLFARSKLWREFKQLPNVQLLGYIDRKELPNYCKAFDVCIIPYRTDSEFNRYVNPDKLHEYTAMGKPVVSTDIPEVRPYHNLIKIGKTSADFIRSIEQSLREDSPAKIRERMEFARQNSWTRRAEEHMNIIEKVWSSKRATQCKPCNL